MAREYWQALEAMANSAWQVAKVQPERKIAVELDF
jgi:hypothetical protein